MHTRLSAIYSLCLHTSKRLQWFLESDTVLFITVLWSLGSDFEGGTYGFEMAVAHGRDLEISAIVECAVVVVGGVHRHKSRPKKLRAVL